jgi:iron complex outermembrane receptor protein
MGHAVHATAGSVALALLVLGILPANAVRAAAEPAAGEVVAQAPPGDQAPAPAPPGARPRGLEAITVTARKVEEDLQSTPVAVSAFTGDMLDSGAIVEIKDLSHVTPGMRFESTPGTGSTATITIRGISQADLLITGDPSVGVYIDGVYNARVIGANFHLLDVDRVEVLKGPQGTLYGRNTPAGAINMWSRVPDGSFGGWGRVRLGEDKRQDVEGAIQFPILGETLSARITGQSQYHDGYVDNDGDKILPALGVRPASTDKVMDDRNKGVRATLRWAPLDSLVVTTRGYYQKMRNHNPNPHILDAFDPRFMPCTASSVACANNIDQNLMQQLVRASDSEQIFLNRDDIENVDYKGGNIDIQWEVGEDTTLKFISGHREYTQDYTTDSDGSPFMIFHIGESWNPTIEKSRQHSDELTLSGVLGENFQYSTGAYYFEERSKTESHTYFGTAAFLPPGRTFKSSADLVSKIVATGLYGQGTYRFTDRLSTTLGLRVTGERRSVRRLFGSCVVDHNALPGFLQPFFSACGNTPLPPGSARVDGLHDRWSALTWLAGLEYQWTDDLFTYGKVSTGYRSGGFNGRLNADPATHAPYDEEKVLSYEAGIKSEFLDNRVRANLAGYYTKYRDIQTTSLITCSTGICTIIQNSGRVNVSGAELEVFTRFLENLELNGTVGWTVFRYSSGPRSGGPRALSNWGGSPAPDVEITRRTEAVNVPAFTYTLSSRYTFPEFAWGIPSVQLDWAYRSEIEGSGDNGRTKFNPLTGADTPYRFTHRNKQANYGVLNGRVALEVPRFNTELAFFVRNMLDREYYAGAVDWAGSASFGYWTHNYRPRRKWGVELTYRFGSDAGS